MEILNNDKKAEESLNDCLQEDLRAIYDNLIPKKVKSFKELSKEQLKQYKKLIGESPLSKKRTRKLLMANGFDRDSAQMYADTMKPRNMSKINKMIKIKEEYIDE